MNRRIITRPRIFLTALVGAQVFLSLLPSLGWIWHSLLPEHEHLYIGVRSENFNADAQIALSDCPECGGVTGDTTLHVPSFSGLQIAAIAVGFAPAIHISIPDGFSSRILSETFSLSPLFLPRLDPPPKAK